jgi:DNA-binding transcriptional LysR family regulator
MPPAIKVTQLFRDPFVVVARKGHPITGAPLTVEAYAACDHVLVSPCGDTSGALDRLLVDYGQRRRVALLVAT